MKGLQCLALIVFFGLHTCWAHLQTETSQRKPQKWAIIIALDKYATVSPLFTSIRDAEYLHSLLINPKGANFDPKNIFMVLSRADDEEAGDSRSRRLDGILLNRDRQFLDSELSSTSTIGIPRNWNAAKKEILPLLDQLLPAGPVEEEKLVIKKEDSVYLFFIGHGGLGADSKEKVFLCPADVVVRGNEGLVNEDSAIALDEFFSRLNRLEGSVFFSIDACRGSGKEFSAAEVGQYIVNRVGKYVIEQPFSTTFITSCRGNELSNQDFTTLSKANPANGTKEDAISSRNVAKIERGVYSYFLCRAFAGGADVNLDGKIMPSELDSYLTVQVPNYVMLAELRSQTPLVVNQGSLALLDCPLTNGISVDTIPSGAQVKLRTGLAGSGGYTGPAPLLPTDIPFLSLTDKDRSPGFAYLSEIDRVLGWADKYNLEIKSLSGHEVKISFQVIEFLDALTIKVIFPQKGREKQLIQLWIQHPENGRMQLTVPADTQSIDLTGWDNRVLHDGETPAKQIPFIKIVTRSRGEQVLNFSEPLYQMIQKNFTSKIVTLENGNLQEAEKEISRYTVKQASGVALTFSDHDNVLATVVFRVVTSKTPLERTESITYRGKYDAKNREIKLTRE